MVVLVAAASKIRRSFLQLQGFSVKYPGLWSIKQGDYSKLCTLSRRALDVEIPKIRVGLDIV